MFVLWMMRRTTQQKTAARPGDTSPGVMHGLGWLAAGAGTVVVGVYFWRYEVLSKFLEIVFATHAAWGNPFPDLFPFGEMWRAGGPHALFERILFYLPLAVYGLVLVLVGREWMKSRTRSLEQWTLLAVAAFGLCAYGLVVWRAGFDNLIRTLAPFHVLLVYVLYRLNRALGGRNSSGKLHWAPEKVLVYFLILSPIWIYLYEMNVTHGFYVGSVGAVRHNTTRLEYDRMQVWTNRYEAEWVNNIVQKIESVTRPGDAVLALPLNPLFNFLTDRENPLVYDWILPGMLDEKAQEDVVRQLKVRLPRLLIYSDIPIDGKEERRFSRYAPVLFQFLQTHYQLWETVGLFQVMIPQGRGFAPAMN
jgi:hypothetical protein